jgi:hypothetical protein
MKKALKQSAEAFLFTYGGVRKLNIIKEKIYRIWFTALNI